MVTHLLLLALASILALAHAVNAAETSIGYNSVSEALSSLRARPDVTIRVKAGWTFVDDRANGTLWSFTPPGHPAYPAVVKRIVTNRDGASHVETRMLCEAERLACADLAEDFYELNDRVPPAIQRGRRSGGQPPTQ